MFGWFKKKKSSGAAQQRVAPPLLRPQGVLGEEVLRRALHRPCAPLIFDKPANIDPFETMFGAVRLAYKDEPWPEYSGVPMWPLCQINLKAAPMVPKALRDLALITIFIAPETSHTPTRIINAADPEVDATWALRSYPSLKGLTIPRVNGDRSPLSPRLGEWSSTAPDYANHDTAGAVVDTQVNDVYAYDWAHGVYQTKLGGWPSTTQSEPWWDYTKTDHTWDYALQIANEPQAGWQGWGDNGSAFLARSRENPHLWAIEVQGI
ncbi:DUF1963 domain-containing protein [uncultured Sulfitobacter sp.]|uniref:DUF1963 domain-containing protein n=1 Tax=uncultured Sulfitobacter sp. TaxID=191468 RepID=UPI00262A3262|nr:DUF1963 domain-containing protein [uncultured Sulfitobacter sp.]